MDSLNDWTLTFSPDGKHLVFAGICGGVTGIWLDGKAAPSDIPIASTNNQESLYFSPDSRRLASAIKGSDGLLHWVVDGKAGPGTLVGLGRLSFSADSAHHAYVLPRAETKDIAIVVDHTIRATYAVVTCGPVFLADGTLEFLAVQNHSLFRFKVTGY